MSCSDTRMRMNEETRCPTFAPSGAPFKPGAPHPPVVGEYGMPNLLLGPRMCPVVHVQNLLGGELRIALRGGEPLVAQ